MKLAYAYIRVSDPKQDTEGTSLESQEAAIKAHARAHGFELLHVYREVHTASELWEREELNKVRGGVRARKVSAVICYSVDRLTRDVAHLAVIHEEAKRYGVELQFVTERLDDSPQGKLMLSVKGYAAEVERLNIIDRTVRGRKQRLYNGKIHSDGLELYGYRRDKARGVRVIHDDEAAVVHLLFEGISQGRSLYALTTQLNLDGVPSPSTAKGLRQTIWNTTAVRNIIRNPNYKGETITWYNKGKKNGGVERRPESDWIRLPAGVTPALVSAKLWEVANASLRANVGSRTRNLSRQYLLRGFVYCATCERRLYPMFAKERRFYHCASSVDAYRYRMVQSCGSARVPAEPLENQVWQQVASVLTNPEATTRLLTEIDAEPESASSEVKLIQKKISLAENGIARLLKRLHVAGDDLAPLIENEIRSTQAERERLLAAAVELEKQNTERAQAVIDQHTLLVYLQNLSAQIEFASFDERAGIFQAIHLKCFVSKDVCRITAKIFTLDGSDSEKNGLPLLLESLPSN